MTVTATEAINSTFIGWSGACTGTANTCTITIDGKKEVTATFVFNEYDLTVARAGNGSGTITSVPDGIDCGMVCMLHTGHGAVIALSATADNRSTFVGWQGACVGVDPLCTLTIAATQAATATFTLKQYDLTVAKTGNGAGLVTSLPAILDCGITCTARVEHGVLVTLTATAEVGAFFDGWAGACTGFGPCVVTMNAAKQITATFTHEPVASLSVALATTPSIAVAGAVITYQYHLTNTGDLSLTIQALSTKLGVPLFIHPTDGGIDGGIDGGELLPGSYLEPGQAVTAVQHTTAARCADDTPLVNTILVTGTTSGGINTTAQASLMTPVNTEPLPPQPALADTVYMGCTIQLAPSLDAAELQQPYTMVVIVGPAPDGLLLYGVQAIQPYTDPLTLQAQTNALLSEGCNTGTCHPVRRMLIEQGKDIQITTIETIAGANQLFIPIVRR